MLDKNVEEEGEGLSIYSASLFSNVKVRQIRSAACPQPVIHRPFAWHEIATPLLPTAAHIR